MVDGFFFAAVSIVPIQMKRKSRYRLGQYPYALIHCRHLHGRAFIDPLAGGTTAEQESVSAAVYAVGHRLIP